jgi:ATP-dependent helicase/nuclease subunit B
MTDTLALVLTPTARLARAENLEIARRQASLGQTAWLKPEVLSFPAWINRLRDDYSLVAEDNRVPIGAHQAQVLWQEVIDSEIFVGEPQVAELAQAAWRLIHEFDLEQPGQWDPVWMSEDNRRFRDWADRYRMLCLQRGLLDEWAFAAQLPELIGAGNLEIPAKLTLRGFELPLTPLQQKILDALTAAGCDVDRERDGAGQRSLKTLTAFVEPDDELRAAACWARGRIEDQPDESIGIVVADLKGRLARVERIFRQVFDPPGFALQHAGCEAFHVSLGYPLARWPLAGHALLLLGLDPMRINQPLAGKLLRSPFFAGWEQERTARNQLLARLNRRAAYWIDAREIMYQASQHGAEILAGKLAAWQACRREHGSRALPSDWARRFQEELSAMGFGHGRNLDSIEFQVLERWHELLESFSQLDLVVAGPIDRFWAMQRLAERARTGVFRQRNPGAAVEILGVEEALGSRFDAVWLTTLDSDTWPRPASRDPLIPGRVQTGLPRATGKSCLERARLELQGLMACAETVLASFARGSGEQSLEPTSLLADCLVVEAEPVAEIDTIELEHLADDRQAPPLASGPTRGGTSVLQSQSDCPFKAFAVYRLTADDLTPPRPGLDARDRGSLLHRALEHFWQDLSGQAALLALAPDELEERIGLAVDQALEGWTRRNRGALGKAGQELEAQCLRQALTRWLDLESQREPFSINGLEVPIDLAFNGLELSGKIDRIDEMDGGGAILIDYKTGQSGRNGWLPDERLADVQLPAYAVSMNPPPAALAFARIRPEAMGFDGLAEVDAGIGGVDVIGQINRHPFKEIESWQALMTGLQASLQGLAGDFVAGKAEVDPRSMQVCRYCHLHGLCRINERVMLMETNDE